MAELYSLPDGWEWKKLGELCDFIRGPFGGSLKKQIFKENGNAVYEQSHAIYNQFEQIRYFIDDEKFEEMKRFELRPNSLIMSCSGTIGKVAIVPNNVKKGIINQALLMLTPNNELNNIFLKLMMESNFFQTLLSDNSTGAAIANVASVKVLKDLDIPLPPLEEQKRIVDKLDNLFAKIDKAIALHQKNIDEADIFMASVLNDVFVELEEKSEIKRLNECFIVKDGTHDSPKYIEDGYPLFTSKNLKDYGLDTSNFNSINKEDYDNINKRSKVDKGDLLFAMIGTIGNPTIVNFEPNFAIKNVALFKPLNEESIMTYLRYYFMSEKTITKMKNEANGATQKFVGLTYLREFPFPFIDVKTQQKVVSYLDEISQKMEKIKNLQKEKMQSLKELKASILDKAFKGEL
ncbi:restriction endonuclease subunit S [Aliarcobacter cryaerophilus]|uniref:restriction endonuclease subunit S n=1 Tax=Aliarcobacter cryaerophilus TaxID=28198 RepID=UPI003DA6B810